MNSGVRGAPLAVKCKLSRLGRKLQFSDDPRTLVALPKDVPERTCLRAEILQKQENDMLILDIREEIFEDAFKICYQKYMDKQTVCFTVHCAAEAWLQLFNWYFFRHDPGEDTSAYPSCSIPKRAESWIPDEPPDPSPKDTWCKQELTVLEQPFEESLNKWPSSSSIEMPFVEDIPEEYWFPGKVNLPAEETESLDIVTTTSSYDDSVSSNLRAESEVLQNVTDYSTSGEEYSRESVCSAVKNPTPVRSSLRGTGDSAAKRKSKRRSDKSKVFTLSRASMQGRSKGALPPLPGDSRSRISVISDCRLRNLRLETQYEITREKIDTPPGEPVKRK
ncbi:uncharacterized protein LOC112044089 [Bicyclus anynana]|uniref:Uncharacterized protein LOC112044089 n=1 Tax=Bicyclus anynana TaxID=110368 RepID=A0ABM3LWZ1_BICAN|nr:uncharacterized protein LOC112044089 [Bicyclus anynana]